MYLSSASLSLAIEGPSEGITWYFRQPWSVNFASAGCGFVRLNEPNHSGASLHASVRAVLVL
jgi:hypothetical protein